MRQRMWITFVFGLFLATILPESAKALPTVFNDRAAFDAAVGSIQLTTFDPLIVTGLSLDPGSLTYSGVINEALSFTADISGAVNMKTVPGGLTFGGPEVGIYATTLSPVMAIGFDVTSFRPDFPNTGAGLLYLTGVGNVGITGPRFIRVLYDTPTIAGISGDFFSEVTIDNLGIKSVPEPPVTLLLGLGLFSLVAWLLCKRRLLAH